jgi:hypothetical protein
MSNAPPRPGAGRPQGLEALVPYRQQFTYALVVVAALLLVYPLVLLAREGVTGATGNPRFYWLVALFVIAAAGAAFNAAYQGLSEVEKLRALLMGLGGAAGFATVVFGLALPWTTYREVFGGGVSEWRANPWPLTWTALAVLGGLALMFASLQLARDVERTSGTLRRILYGFNAVLGTLLLLAILGLVNVLAYVSVAPFSYAKEPWDTTAAGLYTLSPASKNLLAGLKKPVKVYAVLPSANRISKDVEALLENARAIAPQFTWQTVSRDRDRAEYARLQQKYAFPADVGLLVLYGTEPQVDFDFIKGQDLFRSGRGEQFSYSLTAENALMKSLVYLSEGKTHPVIYFTQGEGEMELEPDGPERPAASLSDLRRRLEQGNYTVKPLTLGPDVKSVPADADLVVIARPTRAFTAEGLKALRDYMGGAGGKKGRLVVLMDVAIQNGQMVQTGLEPLLAEFNVRVSNGRVLTLNPRFGRTFIQAITNPRSRNPVAQAFGPREGDEELTAFLFDSPRVVEPLAAGGARGTAYDVDPLLLVVDGGAWDELDVSKDPSVIVAELRKPENLQRWQQLRPKKNLSLAVAVSDSDSGGMPNDPQHAALRQGKGQPRMVVFGDAGWVSSGALGRPENQLNYDLFASCLSWLRERPNIGKVAEDKERKEYALTVPAAAISRIEFLPLGLMALAVIGVGLGVWVVRRR